ncbi:hypothetical protein PHYBLDRAFT_144534 [Phycomyces blakesleeanus NRRL 1555(-)]|uniref:Uncharacterized protein n=1 Tax=Phycomyces blakesleeanus (strain ATCC 8743b / DSM 1359 / FGSC 10004 / NBRC 33097 / NRRL 1555) TaxID=763407 RepID=A0A167MUW6_PHYB8|nr:hypothetical protein PHYBLDRAFT_144534 [Phycomyces blakesleeanus NRRL 1555(-)]OAD74074.1 hypothetical protein PHYBLDRAFT_144534 [Phycomyces blakesleeanus NRRL 1555(-)]|eukprot:XP_018292114.1 hypothetical protein PHYBLDRAFT_144534 [Phycomyces blakesleeanus NRRL 1555(-)]
MSNNQKKESYVICKCPDCTKLDSCEKKQKRQNAQRYYEKHIVPVAKDDAMDVPEEHFDNMEVDSIDSDNDNDYDYKNEGKGKYEDENEEQNIEFDQEEESIFTAEDTITGAFVVDGDEIEEGDTGFDFEQEENFDETSGTSIVESARPSSFDNMPLYICFVAVFIVIFHSIFLVESGRLILVEFCNTLLSLCDMSGALPLTINSLKHKTGFNMAKDRMTVYIACSQWHSIYPPETSQRVCTFKKFSQSTICNNNLFKVSTRNCSLPAMIYPFNSLKYALQQKFSKPDFVCKINLWRNRQKIENTKLDIFDGAVWSDIKDINGRRRTHSSDAIYLSINNLPRSERLKSENDILVDMMPGPKEASTDSMNHYLKPLIDKLLEMYIGLEMTDLQNRKIVVCAELMCIVCDIPATCKASGFTGHMSTCACHKSNALNNTEQTHLKKENGTWWSEIHLLSYFDPVCVTVINLMHNLYLGTAKQMIQIWHKCNYINEKSQLTMQELANGIVVSCGYVRITKKIADGFSLMKADKWKSWCVIYSPFILKHVFPAKNL